MPEEYLLGKGVCLKIICMGKIFSQIHPSPDREEIRLILSNTMREELKIRPRVLDSGQPAFPVTEPISCFTKADSMMAHVRVEIYTPVPDFRAGATRRNRIP